MPDLLKILGDLRKTGASDLLFSGGEPVFVRRNGILEPMKGQIATEDDVRKAILSSSTPKAREILGKHRQVNYAFEDATGARYRFSAYFSKGRFSAAVRLIPPKPYKMSELGLPDALRKVLAKQPGLIIVGSPSGQGKTTTIASLLDFINTHYEKNIITIENPVEIRFKDERSSFLQRGIPLDVPNFYEGLNEANRLDPDVVVSDSISYKDALDQALFLCESGCLVIGASEGGSSHQIVERIIYGRPLEEREAIKGKLATHLSLVIGQKLVPRSEESLLNARPEEKPMLAVFDILVNTPQVKTILRSDSLAMLKTLQDQDQGSGMQSFDRHLATLVRKFAITGPTAVAYAEDPADMLVKFPAKTKG